MSVKLFTVTPQCSITKKSQTPPPDLSSVPKVHYGLQLVLSKYKAVFLTSRHLHDCAVDQFSGATLPTGHLYNLSHLEREAMETYIWESLVTGIIQYALPLLGSFSFLRRITLGPYIYYRGLNQITIENK